MNVVASVLALGGLATLDVFVLLPLALLVGGLTLVAALVLTVAGLIGVTQFLTVPWRTFDGIADVVALLLGSIGLMAAATSGGAFLIAGLDSAVRVLGRYARLHYRLAERTETAGGRP